MTAPQLSHARALRVLIVDDSAFMRRALTRIVEAADGLAVAGVASDGLEAVRQAIALRPDVITMDVEMPGLDGVQAVAEIMAALPTPVVMVSALTSSGTDTAIRALEAGAIECVAKPTAADGLAVMAQQMVGAIQRAGAVRVRRMVPQAPASWQAGPRRLVPASSNLAIVIGASTGGPPALTEVVSHLPGDLPAGVIVVQHMPAGFTDALARRLSSLSPLDVEEARPGMLVEPGRVIVARGGEHLTVGRDRRVALSGGPARHGVRPSIDITLESVLAVYGGRAIVAILTGMGKDGAQGAAAIEQAGGQVIAQDEATSVVYGMPRVTREMTQRAAVLPLGEVAGAITKACAVGARR